MAPGADSRPDSRLGADAPTSVFATHAPAVALPKGGGAIRGIGETFAADPMKGTAALSVPIAVSPGRSGFGPSLTLRYDSGAGNGPFGLGWNVALSAITRRTDKGLPQYRDGDGSDVFTLAGADDLVPLLAPGAQGWRSVVEMRSLYGRRHTVRRYRPRIEGLFAVVERWTADDDAGNSFWRSISKDNVTSWFGLDAASRIADPADPAHIYSWLVCEVHDDKGNLVEYRYKPEDSAGIAPGLLNERNRSPAGRSAGRYPGRIRYGHRSSYFPSPDAASKPALPDDPSFEIVFDYGEHDALAPVPSVEQRPWALRPDPFSTHRPGFELRSYRRCQRVLMFHHFPDQADVGADCAVRSTEFGYADADADPADPSFSLLASVTEVGWRRAPAGYLRQAMPALLFDYIRPTIDPAVRTLDAVSLRNLPAGIDGTRYRWVDLDGEGLSGILSGEGGAWIYKANLGALGQAAFGPAQRLDALPSAAQLNGGGQQLVSLSGNGALDLVDYQGPDPGFAERGSDGRWSRWTGFAALPRIAWNNPELKFIDLTGDGLPDLLIAEDDAFVWHASLAQEGFAAARRVQQALDEEQGPRLVFADGTDSIFLADMTGDGLSDLVRVRNGECCYWPNQGYGRFGAKVAMDNAPWFDRPGSFSGRRLRLADIDGSGTADLVYFGSRGTQLYFNLSGNAWSAPRTLDAGPAWDALGSAQVIDLLGNGTGCLVWSSPSPGQARTPLRWVDLMSGHKPHLLTRIDNNLGRETRVDYAPSTRFYVADKLAGTPWLTRLPFPVQVVAQVEELDWISRNRFVTQRAYHHGFFDGVEREFRGFGLVEQWDSETLGALGPAGDFPDPSNADASSTLPPVCTRTWFHTGAWADGRDLTSSFAAQYFAEPGLDSAQNAALRLPASPLPAVVRLSDGSTQPHALSPDEAREAVRALQGSVLRQEVTAQDGSAAAAMPYSAIENNFSVELLQPRGPNRHAVFFAHARESLQLQYERATYPLGTDRVADPRTQHTLTLAVDSYGNVGLAVSVAYGRRHADPSLEPSDQAVQARLLVTATHSGYTAPEQTPDAWRAPLPAQTQGYELLHGQPAAAPPGVPARFGFDEMAALWALASDGLHDLPYEDVAGAGATQAQPYRRLIESSRQIYWADDLSAPLPLGSTGLLALEFERYRLALTPGLIAATYGAKLAPAPLAAALFTEAGYRDLDSDGQAWQVSSRSFLSPNPLLPDPGFARSHFYLVQAVADPFGNLTQISHDAQNLLVTGTQDALGNVTAAQNDYRVLRPTVLTEANGNRTLVAFDALGLVAGSAVMGKAGETLGDSMLGFEADLSAAETAAYVAAADPRPLAAALLAGASTRFVYDLGRFAATRAAAPNDPGSWLPAFASSIARETHVSDLGQGQASALQIAFAHSDGFGRVIQSKLQAAPALPGGPVRWVGSGWTVYDNKGRPVRQYEPFFSALATQPQGFEFGVAVGVSAIVVRDPPGRAVATVRPNQSWEKQVFDPWQLQAWDANDTVLVVDPRADPDVGTWLARLDASELLPTWYQQRVGGALGAAAQAAAQAVAQHAATPARTGFDPLGRSCYSVADNGTAGQYLTRTLQDVQGHVLATVDELGRIAARDDWDLLGNCVHHASMEAGERWLLQDTAGQPLRRWDSRGHAQRMTYDALRRPVAQFVLGTDATQSDPRTLAAEMMVARTVYGEGQPSDTALNLRGRVAQRFDAAGVLTFRGIDASSGQEIAYDFKGNPRINVRRMLQDAEALPDWSGAPALDAESFATRTDWDALNRPRAAITPDGSITRPGYDAGGRLQSLSAELQGAALATTLLTAVAYNARGQRLLAVQGNGAQTRYDYDPQTCRLAQLITTRSGFGAGQGVVQQLSYTDDPVGNVTHVQDDADIQNVVYFRNRRIEPSADYRYDAIYRLVSARGREHLGQLGGGGLVPGPASYNDAPRASLPHPGDGNAMGTYFEQYGYDAAGNLLQVQHAGSDPANPGWARSFVLAEASQIEAGRSSNRLTHTVLGANGKAPQNEDYGHDLHGNMTRMPQLQRLDWDFEDRLRASQRQAVNADDADGAVHQGERSFFVHDGSGRRQRKLTRRANGTRMKERLYLGSFEIYREFDGTGQGVTLERQTLHLIDGSQRVALVETRTSGDDGTAAQLLRFVYGNHLGSACLELDAGGRVISYEEYHPFGTTSYQAVDAAVRAAAKRYRFGGMERDEETGLSAQGARYAALWLGRWVSADPAGLVDGSNLYAYVRDNPVRRIDPQGTDSTNATDAEDQKGTPPAIAAVTADAAAKGKLGPFQLKLDPPNFLSSSYSQSLGLITAGREDVEINAYGIGAAFRGLGQRPQAGGGLLFGQISDRRTIDAVPGLDAGVALSLSATGQGTAEGDSHARGIGALGLLHYAGKVYGDFGLGLYASGGVASQVASGSDTVTTPTASATGVIGYEPDAPDHPQGLRFGGVDLNPTASVAGRGQLSQGPTLSNLYTVGGHAGVNLGLGERWSLLPEAGALYSHGVADAASGSTQTGQSVTWRAGIAATYSWLDGGATPATNSLSFGAWYSEERGTIGAASGAPPAPPAGDFVTRSVVFGLSYGFRHQPFF